MLMFLRQPRIWPSFFWMAVIVLLPGALAAQFRSDRFDDSRPGSNKEGTPLSTPGERLRQARKKLPSHLKTRIEVTILLPKFSSSLTAQRWAKQFSAMKIDAQFRQPVYGDKLEIKERIRGTLRRVTLIGQLDRSGRLTFPDRVFTREDGKALQEWLDELKVYGAQGAPSGKPLWGLNKEQFSELYESLSQQVRFELEGTPLSEALKKLPIPPQHPLSSSAAADDWSRQHPGERVKNQVQGLTLGTVLACILREAGLGFRPLRKPSGQIDLVIMPLSKLPDPWPVGWELEDQSTQSDLAPSLYQFVEIGFEDAAIEDVLDAAAAAIKIPILVDDFQVEKSGVNLSTKLVTYPSKRTSWSLMLNTVVRKAGMIKKVKIDEAGRPFVWVAPFVPTKIESSR